jgi:hypothetical protein
LGFGFTQNDPMRPPLFVIALVLLAAVGLRAIINVVMRARGGVDRKPPAPPAARSETFDPLF